MVRAKKKVLIADENGRDLQSLMTLLESRGYTVISARDGSSAQRLAVSEKPDLVILDVTLPMKSGFAVAKFLKGYDKTSSIPVIMMSGRRTSQDDLDFGYKSGAAYYFLKPLDVPKFMSAAADLLAERPQESDVARTPLTSFEHKPAETG